MENSFVPSDNGEQPTADSPTTSQTLPPEMSDQIKALASSDHVTQLLESLRQNQLPPSLSSSSVLPAVAPNAATPFHPPPPPPPPPHSSALGSPPSALAPPGLSSASAQTFTPMTRNVTTPPPGVPPPLQSLQSVNANEMFDQALDPSTTLDMDTSGDGGQPLEVSSPTSKSGGSGKGGKKSPSQQQQQQERKPILYPPYSRMFVGNLRPGGITEADLKAVFSSYGEVKEVSIKTSFAFVQFGTADDCRNAIAGENGRMLKGKRMELEMCKSQPRYGYTSMITADAEKESKPASNSNEKPGKMSSDARHYSPPRHRGGRSGKSSRNRHGGAGGGGGGGGGGAVERAERGGGGDGHRGRSLSPDNRRGSDFRTGGGRRDLDQDYPLTGSNAIGGGGGGRRGDFQTYRSGGGGGGVSLGGTAERGGGVQSWRDEERRGMGVEFDRMADEYPLPRRFGRDVPFCQIFVLDELDRNFIAYVENALRRQHIPVDTIFLSPRIPLRAAVLQVVREGVRGVIFLEHRHQSVGKISLQVFGNSPDLGMKYDEYDDITAEEGANILLRARSHSEAAAVAASMMSMPTTSYSTATAPAATTPYGYPDLNQLIPSFANATAPTMQFASIPQQQTMAPLQATAASIDYDALARSLIQAQAQPLGQTLNLGLSGLVPQNAAATSLLTTPAAPAPASNPAISQLLELLKQSSSGGSNYLQQQSSNGYQQQQQQQPPSSSSYNPN